ncbi:MAG: GtrA family protein [Methanospirillum sp.]|uniref:GtrA family protein n=1 Tax=Methanospirillum sp. TaxID=45200 RepID=UPI00236DF387|nr:GtrA family protein [Methanospirillum sp.]MDD1729878.1 GtrA family protein [Methanospirillum sp.]
MTLFSAESGEGMEYVPVFHVGSHLGGFLLIGIVTTSLDISILWFLTEKVGIWYLASAGLSYCSGTGVSYLLNKTLNYRNQSRSYVKQGSSFLVIAASSFALNLAIISGCVEIFLLNYLLAKIVATAVACLWNYYGQSTITFRIWR